MLRRFRHVLVLFVSALTLAESTNGQDRFRVPFEMIRAYDAYVSRYYDEAFAGFEKLHRDIPEANFYLGECQQFGRGTKQDYLAAARSYHRAVIERKSVHAALRIAEMTQQGGHGLKADEEKAQQWRDYAKSVAMKRIAAYDVQFQAHIDGLFSKLPADNSPGGTILSLTGQDPLSAERQEAGRKRRSIPAEIRTLCSEMLAREPNNALAYYLRGKLYATWFQDKALAEPDLAQAKQLVSDGQLKESIDEQLALLEKLPEPTGRVREKSRWDLQNERFEAYCRAVYSYRTKYYAAAFRSFQELAQVEFARAYFRLAECYQFGRGTPADFRAAAKWYEKSGTVSAALRLADLHEQGGPNLAADTALAQRWHENAKTLAEQDNAEREKSDFKGHRNNASVVIGFIDGVLKKDSNPPTQEELKSVIDAEIAQHFCSVNIAIQPNVRYYLQRARLYARWYRDKPLAQENLAQATRLLAKRRDESYKEARFADYATKVGPKSLQQAYDVYDSYTKELESQAKALTSFVEKLEQPVGLAGNPTDAIEFAEPPPRRSVDQLEAMLGAAVYAYHTGYYQHAFEEFKELARYSRMRMAQYYLGECYRLGRGTEIDFAASANWYEKSEQDGWLNVPLRLAELYDRGGHGLTANDRLAKMWRDTAQGRAQPGKQAPPPYPVSRYVDDLLSKDPAQIDPLMYVKLGEEAEQACSLAVAGQPIAETFYQRARLYSHWYSDQSLAQPDLEMAQQLLADEASTDTRRKLSADIEALAKEIADLPASKLHSGLSPVAVDAFRHIAHEKRALMYFDAAFAYRMRHYDVAFEALWRLGEAEYDLAYFLLAECYQLGRGTRVDYAQAARLYDQVDHNFDLDARLRLADLYESGGQGLAANIEKAVELRARSQKAAQWLETKTSEQPPRLLRYLRHGHVRYSAPQDDPWDPTVYVYRGKWRRKSHAVSISREPTAGNYLYRARFYAEWYRDKQLAALDVARARSIAANEPEDDARLRLHARIDALARVVDSLEDSVGRPGKPKIEKPASDEQTRSVGALTVSGSYDAQSASSASKEDSSKRMRHPLEPANRPDDEGYDPTKPSWSGSLGSGEVPRPKEDDQVVIRAKAGDVDAQLDLAIIHFRRKNFAEAKKLFGALAKEGNNRARQMLGQIERFEKRKYEAEVDRVMQSAKTQLPDELKNVFERAISGDAESQFRLAMEYANRRDAEAARKWVELSASQGHQPSLQLYARIREVHRQTDNQGSPSGSTKKTRLSPKLDSLTFLATSGNGMGARKARLDLATEYFKLGDLEAAKTWLQRAADQGMVTARELLSILVAAERNKSGVDGPITLEPEYQPLIARAESADAQAQFELAKVYRSRWDLQTAKKWLEMSAELGHRPATEMLRDLDGFSFSFSTSAWAHLRSITDPIDVDAVHAVIDLKMAAEPTANPELQRACLYAKFGNPLWAVDDLSRLIGPLTIKEPSEPQDSTNTDQTAQRAQWIAHRGAIRKILGDTDGDIDLAWVLTTHENGQAVVDQAQSLHRRAHLEQAQDTFIQWSVFYAERHIDAGRHADALKLLTAANAASDSKVAELTKQVKGRLAGERFDAARKFASEEHFDKADIELQKVVALSATDDELRAEAGKLRQIWVDTLMKRTRELIEQGEYEAARKNGLVAARLAPDDSDVRKLLVGASQGAVLDAADAAAKRNSEGRKQEAIALYKKAIALDPSAVWLHADLALIYYDLKDWIAELAAYDGRVAAAELSIAWETTKPESAKKWLASALYDRAVALRWQGDFQSAIADLTRSLDTVPDVGKVYLQLGVCQRSLGMQDEADTAFRRATELDASLAAKIAKIKESPPTIQKLSQAEIGSRLRKRIGEFKLRDANFAGAKSDFMRALELNPGDESLQSLCGLAHLEQGELDQAIDLLARSKQFAELDPVVRETYETRLLDAANDEVLHDERRILCAEWAARLGSVDAAIRAANLHWQRGDLQSTKSWFTTLSKLPDAYALAEQYLQWISHIEDLRGVSHVEAATPALERFGPLLARPPK